MHSHQHLSQLSPNNVQMATTLVMETVREPSLFHLLRVLHHPDKRDLLCRLIAFLLVFITVFITPIVTQAHPISVAPMGVGVPVEILATRTVPFPRTRPITQNVIQAAVRLDGLIVSPGQVNSFLAAMGEISRDRGYIPADAIVGGVITQDIGGGICYVSTALYRAALAGGLAIIERHAHSLALRSFRDLPGLDSAVATPRKDLRWRNDTAHPIQIQAHVDARAGTVTVTLRGIPDGRTTIIMHPIQTERPDGGSTVRVVRRIHHADGVIQHETIISRYALLSPSPAR